MFPRSRPLSSLLRLYQRRLLSEGRTGPSSGDTIVQEAKSGSGWKNVAVGAVVLMTGVAVYQNRHLFNEYPTHAIILKPDGNLQSPPTTTGQVTSQKSIPEAAAAVVVASQQETTYREGTPQSKQISPATNTTKPKQEAPNHEPESSEPDTAIPPEIVDNTSIVELFSEALAGQSGIEQATETDVFVADELQKLLTTDASVQTLSAKLLATSLKEAVETKPDWTELKARQKQAVYDATMMKLYADKERENRREAMRSLEHTVQDGVQHIEQLKNAIATVKLEAEQNLQQALDQAEQKHKEEVKQVTEQVTMQATQKSMQETTQRLGIIDQLREKVNVLTMALSYWKDRTQSFMASEQLGLQAVTMERSLDVEEVGFEWMQPFSEKEAKDSLVQASLNCLPTEAIPSKRQLIRDLSSLRKSVEYLTLLPPSGGGLLAQMMATIGTRLKIKVPEMYADMTEISAKLDRVERVLADGAVSEAISLLDEIIHETAAAHLCENWIHDAQRYCTLQEIRRILLARAQELTVSATVI